MFELIVNLGTDIWACVNCTGIEFLYFYCPVSQESVVAMGCLVMNAFEILPGLVTRDS